MLNEICEPEMVEAICKMDWPPFFGHDKILWIVTTVVFFQSRAATLLPIKRSACMAHLG